MSIISWIFRDLGHQKEILVLKDLVQLFKPDILFLCETIMNANKIEELTVKLAFQSTFVVDKEGGRQGLGLFSQENLECNIMSHSTNFVRAKVRQEEGLT